MPDKDEKPKALETIDVQAFLDTQALVAKLQEQLAAMQGTLDEAAKEKEALAEEKNAAVKAKETIAAEKATIENALAAQELERLKDTLIHEHQASPALLKVVMPLLEQADPRTVQEFSDGSKATPRDELKQAIIQIIQMKKADALTVPTGEQAPAQHDAPADTTPENEGVRMHQRVQEYMAQHNINDYAAAWTAVQTARA